MKLSTVIRLRSTAALTSALTNCRCRTARHPTNLVDIVDPTEEYSAAQYARDAARRFGIFMAAGGCRSSLAAQASSIVPPLAGCFPAQAAIGLRARLESIAERRGVIDPAEHERARRPAVVAQVHDQGKAELEVLAVARGERRLLGEPAEDREMSAVVANELEGDEAPARQEIETGVQQAAGFGGRRPLELAPGRWGECSRRVGVEQQQALIDREAQRLVGLLQPPLGLAPELPSHVAVRDNRNDRDGQHRAAHEQQEEPSPEPAVQGCRS